MRSMQMFVCRLAKAIITLFRGKTAPPKMSRTWYMLWYYISVLYRHIQEQCPNVEQIKILKFCKSCHLLLHVNNSIKVSNEIGNCEK